MAETYEWPEDLRPSECAFFLRANTTLLESPITSVAQAIGRPGARWVCEIALGPVGAARAARLDALLARLQGSLHRVRLWDFRRPAPRGPAQAYGVQAPGTWPWAPAPSWGDNTGWEDGPQAATPALRLAAARGATTLAAWGFAASAVPLLAGDLIGLGGRLYMLVVDAPAASALGHVTLTVTPGLRADAAAGAALTLTRPTTPFRLADNDQASNRTRAGLLTSYSLRFAEDLT